jgi:hypothetical protein
MKRGLFVLFVALALLVGLVVATSVSGKTEKTGLRWGSLSLSR